ncbi:hypothetical protein BDR07DRAFT_434442 [Suillus spraguei]|nr:hypothetical protein BDR07DRAFT_434442 [Suillus spraguei]
MIFALYALAPKPLLCTFIFRLSTYILRTSFQSLRVQFFSFWKFRPITHSTLLNSNRPFGPISPSVIVSHGNKCIQTSCYVCLNSIRNSLEEREATVHSMQQEMESMRQKISECEEGKAQI